MDPTEPGRAQMNPFVDDSAQVSAPQSAVCKQSLRSVHRKGLDSGSAQTISRKLSQSRASPSLRHHELTVSARGARQNSPAAKSASQTTWVRSCALLRTGVALDKSAPPFLSFPMSKMRTLTVPTEWLQAVTETLT